MAKVSTIYELIDRMSDKVRKIGNEQTKLNKILKDSTKHHATYDKAVDRSRESVMKMSKSLQSYAKSLTHVKDEEGNWIKSNDRMARNFREFRRKITHDVDQIYRVFRGRRGLLGGFSGFVILAASGLLAQLGTAVTAVGAGILALAPATAAAAAGFGVLGAVAIPMISRLTEKYSALADARDKVNKAKTIGERDEALKELRALERGITPFEAKTFAQVARLRQSWRQATAPVRGNVERTITGTLGAAQNLLGPATPAIREFGARFESTTGAGLRFLQNPRQVALMQRALAPLPEMGQTITEIFGKMLIVFQGLSIAITPLAEHIFGTLNNKMSKLVEITQSEEGLQKWTDAFNRWGPAVDAVGSLLSGLVVAIVRLGEVGRPHFIKLVEALNKHLLPALERFSAELIEVVGPFLPKLADHLARFIDMIGPAASDLLKLLVPALDAVLTVGLNVLEVFRSMPKAFEILAGAGIVGLITAGKLRKAGGALSTALGNAPDGSFSKPFHVIVLAGGGGTAVVPGGGRNGKAGRNLGKAAAARGLLGRAAGGIGALAFGGAAFNAGIESGWIEDNIPLIGGPLTSFFGGTKEDQRKESNRQFAVDLALFAKYRDEPALFEKHYKKRHPFFFGNITDVMKRLETKFMGPLPKMAAGGITSGPSLAGESGIEAVIPLRKRTQKGQAALNAANAAYGGTPAVAFYGDVNIYDGSDMNELMSQIEKAVKRAQKQLPRLTTDAAMGTF